MRIPENLMMTSETAKACQLGNVTRLIRVAKHTTFQRCVRQKSKLMRMIGIIATIWTLHLDSPSTILLSRTCIYTVSSLAFVIQLNESVC